MGEHGVTYLDRTLLIHTICNVSHLFDCMTHFLFISGGGGGGGGYGGKYFSKFFFGPIFETNS